jgi:hypothetical protein
VRPGDPVFTTSIWSKTPTYHRRGDWGWKRTWSACGRVNADNATHLPLRAARAIGQPCKICWPNPAERPRPIIPTSHSIWRAVQA